jgi:hypothetical protein
MRRGFLEALAEGAGDDATGVIDCSRSLALRFVAHDRKTILG